METITIRIDKRTKAGKAALALVEVLKGQNGVEVEVNQKSPYDQQFVRMVKQAASSKERTEVNPEDVWGSLGLR